MAEEPTVNRENSIDPPGSAPVASALTDVRQAPLGQLPTAETLRRVRPLDSRRVPVAAFNASL